MRLSRPQLDLVLWTLWNTSVKLLSFEAVTSGESALCSARQQECTLDIPLYTLQPVTFCPPKGNNHPGGWRRNSIPRMLVTLQLSLYLRLSELSELPHWVTRHPCHLNLHIYMPSGQMARLSFSTIAAGCLTTPPPGCRQQSASRLSWIKLSPSDVLLSWTRLLLCSAESDCPFTVIRIPWAWMISSLVEHFLLISS